MYELIGTTKQQVRILEKSNNIDYLRKFGKQLAFYSIYREYDSYGNKFHSTISKSHLVEHCNDPYWNNEITKLKIERDEILGDMASHGLDLSDKFQQIKERFDSLIEELKWNYKNT